MLVETDNLVTADDFRKNLDKYFDAARHGRGPVAITQNSELVGFFIGPDEFEAMFGSAVHSLLSSRTKGRLHSQEEVRASIRKLTAKKS
jgi:prevent-host-death family protein